MRHFVRRPDRAETERNIAGWEANSTYRPTSIPRGATTVLGDHLRGPDIKTVLTLD